MPALDYRRADMLVQQMANMWFLIHQMILDMLTSRWFQKNLTPTCSAWEFAKKSQVEFVGFQLPSAARLAGSAYRAEASMRWRMNSEQVTWKMTWQLWRGDAFWTRQTQRIFSWQRMALALDWTDWNPKCSWSSHRMRLVLVYIMLTWLGYIDGIHGTPYMAYMDPSWAWLFQLFHENGHDFRSINISW